VETSLAGAAIVDSLHDRAMQAAIEAVEAAMKESLTPG